MKELARYLIEHPALSLILIALIVVAGIGARYDVLVGWYERGPTSRALDPVLPEVAEQPLLPDQGTQVPRPTLTPTILGNTCEPVVDCSPPTFTITGQFCQSKKPYTNVKVVSADEIYIELPDRETWTDVSYDEVSQTLLITVIMPDGSIETYHIHDISDSKLKIAPIDLQIMMKDINCSLASYDELLHTYLISCTSLSNSSMGYYLLDDPCSCENESLMYVEIPFLACGKDGNSEEGGEEDGGGECPRGQNLYCPGSAPCYCR